MAHDDEEAAGQPTVCPRWAGHAACRAGRDRSIKAYARRDRLASGRRGGHPLPGPAGSASHAVIMGIETPIASRKTKIIAIGIVIRSAPGRR
jgi:hypothetical protein